MAKSKRYKTILLTRFLGYFIFLTGILSFLAIFSPILNVEFSYRWDNILGKERTVATLPEPMASSLPVASGDSQTSSPTIPVTGQGFGDLAASSNTIVPVSTDFGLVIEKINANARVIPGVNPGNEKEYVEALKYGEAEA